MDSLGILMAPNGFTMPYGKINKQGESHEQSFKRDVLNSNFFKKLNISYNEENSFFDNNVALASQGIISILNLSENDEKSVVLFLSDKLTLEQRRLMYYFYPELVELDNCCAMTVSQTSETEHYYDIDEYYQDYKIGYQKVMK